MHPWHRDRGALRFIALRFAPWFLALSLAWETAHARLYNLWTEAAPSYIAFAVAHCTLGDLVIGLAALMLALVLLRQGPLQAWRLVPIAVLATALGTAYTVFSEWMNITLLRSWAYTESMPRIPLGSFELGLTPLAQWLLLPPLAVWAASSGLRAGRARSA